MKHTPECIAAYSEYEKELAEWIAKWPDHCKECDGRGYFYDTYDPSPSGVSLSAGYMEDIEPCLICLESCVCPRCGKHMDIMANLIESDDYSEEHEVCEHCGWTVKSKDIKPYQPDCACYLLDNPEETWP